MNAIWVVVIASVTTSIVSPLVLWWVSHATRKQEWARQDAVAERAAEVAEQAARAAKLLAEQTAQTAKLLISSNSQVAAVARETSEEVARTAAITNGKLDEIHVQVNSNLTAQMQLAVDSAERELTVLLELIAFKKAAGHEPTADTVARLAATRTRLDELKAAMAERIEQTAAADFQLQQTGKPTEAPTQYRRID